KATDPSTVTSAAILSAVTILVEPEGVSLSMVHSSSDGYAAVDVCALRAAFPRWPLLAPCTTVRHQYRRARRRREPEDSRALVRKIHAGRSRARKSRHEPRLEVLPPGWRLLEDGDRAIVDRQVAARDEVLEQAADHIA